MCSPELTHPLSAAYLLLSQKQNFLTRMGKQQQHNHKFTFPELFLCSDYDAGSLHDFLHLFSQVLSEEAMTIVPNM